MRYLNFYLNPNPPKPPRVAETERQRAVLSNHRKILEILKQRGVNIEDLNYTSAMFKLADIIYKEILNEVQN